ncbi:asparaginase [Rothia terrae]|uniref:asparaginase n=1 Tax=Rothia terrae TaxID=396015 RepID=UPI0034010674
MVHTQPQALDKYPERFRARVAGRVSQVRFSAPGEPLRYEAELIVTKSRPVSLSKTRTLMTGLPAIETSGDFSEEPDADEDQQTAVAHERAPHPEYSKPALKFPEYPPLKQGSRLLLIWHGQRSVPGIAAGTEIRCNGLLSTRMRPATMYNPLYEIIPSRR